MPLGRWSPNVGVQHAGEHLPNCLYNHLRLGHTYLELIQSQLCLSQKDVLLDDVLAGKLADHDDSSNKSKLGVGRDRVVLCRNSERGSTPSSDPSRST